MLVIPPQAAVNRYILPPQVVCHSIFGLFILEDWQIDLHPKTPFWPCQSIAFSWHSYMVECQELWLLPQSELPPEEGEPPEVYLGNYGLPCLLCFLLTSLLRMSISLLRPLINCIIISHLPFRSILFHAPHPLFDVICCGGGLHYLCHSVGMSWPSSFSSLFHNCIHNGLVTFLYSIYSHLKMSCLPAQLIGPIKLDCINLKGILEEAPICDILSSNKSTSSLRLWTASPVSLAAVLWDEGVREVPFWASSPPK